MGEEVPVAHRLVRDLDLDERTPRPDAGAGATVPEDEGVSIGVAVEDAVIEAARSRGSRKRWARAKDDPEVRHSG
jgi:hypothetical protein